MKVRKARRKRRCRRTKTLIFLSGNHMGGLAVHPVIAHDFQALQRLCHRVHRLAVPAHFRRNNPAGESTVHICFREGMLYSLLYGADGFFSGFRIAGAETDHEHSRSLPRNRSGCAGFSILEIRCLAAAAEQCHSIRCCHLLQKCPAPRRIGNLCLPLLPQRFQRLTDCCIICQFVLHFPADCTGQSRRTAVCRSGYGHTAPPPLCRHGKIRRTICAGRYRRCHNPGSLCICYNLFILRRIISCRKDQCGWVLFQQRRSIQRAEIGHGKLPECLRFLLRRSSNYRCACLCQCPDAPLRHISGTNYQTRFSLYRN